MTVAGATLRCALGAIAVGIIGAAIAACGGGQWEAPKGEVGGAPPPAGYTAKTGFEDDEPPAPSAAPSAAPAAAASASPAASGAPGPSATPAASAAPK